MGKYNGLPCAHCQHIFTDNDDVVVCPDCGAPHHRACYRERGTCADQQKHGEGYVWLPPVQKNVGGDVHGVVCKNCQTPNSADSLFCRQCNQKLSDEAAPASHRFGAFDPAAASHRQPDGLDFEFDGVSAREISAYVGGSSFYFLRQFRLLMGTKFNISWNWGAFLFKFVYFFYRKMYLAGAAFFALGLISLVPSLFYSIEFFKANALEFFGVAMTHDAQLLDTLAAVMPFLNFFSFVLSAACGLLANKLYLQKVVHDVKTLKEQHRIADANEYYAVLRLIGRPNLFSVFAVIAGFFMLYSSIASHLVNIMGL